MDVEQLRSQLLDASIRIMSAFGISELELLLLETEVSVQRHRGKVVGEDMEPELGDPALSARFVDHEVDQPRRDALPLMRSVHQNPKQLAIILVLFVHRKGDRGRFLLCDPFGFAVLHRVRHQMALVLLSLFLNAMVHLLLSLLLWLSLSTPVRFVDGDLFLLPLLGLLPLPLLNLPSVEELAASDGLPT